MELKPIGVINKLSVSRELNKDIGSFLHLHDVRTDLDLPHFEKLFFTEGMDGDYLRRCCGREDVYLRIIKYPFRAVHCVAGWRTDKKSFKLFLKTQIGTKVSFLQVIYYLSMKSKHMLSILLNILPFGTMEK